MSDAAVHHAGAVVKKHWPLFAAGAVGLYIIYKVYEGSGSTATTSTVYTGPDAATIAAENQAQLQQQQLQMQADAQAQQNALNVATLQAQTQLAQQQLTNQATNANQQNQILLTGQIGQTIGQIGAAVGNVYAAEAQLPAAALAAGSALDQTALSAAAGVAAAGFNSLGNTYAGLGQMMGALTGNFGTTLINLNNAQTQNTANVLGAIGTVAQQGLSSNATLFANLIGVTNDVLKGTNTTITNATTASVNSSNQSAQYAMNANSSATGMTGALLGGLASGIGYGALMLL